MQTKRRPGRPRMYAEPPKILAVPLPAPIHEAVKVTAAHTGVSAAALVRRFLVNGLPSVAPLNIVEHPRQLIK